jgi:transposase
MPRLSEETKHQIIALRNIANLSWNKIASLLAVKKSTARSVVQKKAARGSVANRSVTGRPGKFTDRASRCLKRVVNSHRFSTLREITILYNQGRHVRNQVCSRTVQRALHRLGFYGRVAAKKLKLSLRTGLTRINWCRNHLALSVHDWAKVIFTDEARFGFRSDGSIRVWRKRGERYSTSCMTTTSTSRASIMLWGYISWNGVGLITRCSNRMTSMEYISVMNASSIPLLPQFQLIYMDDNAPIHRSNVVKRWKEENEVECLEWPPYSPDLNPIENIWAFLKKGLRNLAEPPLNLEELHVQVVRLWDLIPLTFIRHLYESMPRRMQLCLKNRGFPIKY